ncbi:hypothetical protein N9Z12_02830 [Opitutaceae bacterium]|nr:hypothetical protein [bacterium]MDB4384963.1 hypothetical protein [Opitutaceae bacterium]
MSHSNPVTNKIFILILILGAPLWADSESNETRSVANNFGRDQIHAWAFTNFDIHRSAAERAEMLQRLGFRKAGYIVSKADAQAAFDDHVVAYQRRGIEMISVWWQSTSENLLEDPKTQMVLAGIDRHEIRPTIWFSLAKSLVAEIPEEERVDRAVAIIRPLAIETRKRGIGLALYNHMEWFGETENQIAIIERLREEGDMDHVGIVYNMHHGHDRIVNFSAVFARMQPYLIAFNLNGMRIEGPKIIRLGEGDREAGMIKTVIDSGFEGPIGILHHFARQDAEPVYRANMQGLKSILIELGYDAVAASYVD